MGCLCKAESDLIVRISTLTDELHNQCGELAQALESVPADSTLAANHFSHVVLPLMDGLRASADALELITDKSYWPFPTYSDLLFY